MTDQIRTLIADDHALLREGLARLLQEEPGIEVVGQAADAQEAIRKAQELRPNVVLMDVIMPGMGGLQAARKLHPLAPEVKVVMLTVSDTEQHVSEALKAGVFGYVLKDASRSELVEAIRTVHRGERWLSPAIEKLVVDPEAEASDVQTVSERLTRREREVCRMLAMGHTVPEIAQIIGISRKTVDVHKTRLMKKLDVHNRAELVRYAIQNQMVEV